MYSDSGSGDNRTVCHGCSETGEVYCCDNCPSAWCKDYIPAGSVEIDVGDAVALAVVHEIMARAAVVLIGLPPQVPAGRSVVSGRKETAAQARAVLACGRRLKKPAVRGSSVV